MNSEQQDPSQSGEDAQPESDWTDAEREQLRYMVRMLLMFLVVVGLTSAVMMVIINYILA